MFRSFALWAAAAILVLTPSLTLAYPEVGWYLMGSPQPYDIYVDDTLWTQDGGGSQPFSSIMNVWVQDPLVYYSNALAKYRRMGLLEIDDDDHFRAFRGYWMYVFESGVSVTFPAP